MSDVSKTYSDHSWLYDAAFSWDVSGEVEWLLSRLQVASGAPPRRILEPACGSARMFPEFARPGVVMTGLDASEAMLARARARLEALGLRGHRLERCDITDFELGERYDGAICPINTLGLLTTSEKVSSHLRAVGRHLVPGARYLVQLDLVDVAGYTLSEPDDHSRWEVDHPNGRVRCSVYASAWDPDRRIERQNTHFEILTGPRAGDTFEDTDDFLIWDWATWRETIRASPFSQGKAFDGSRAGRWPEVTPGPRLEGMRLLWHELRLEE